MKFGRSVALGWVFHEELCHLAISRQQ